MSASQSARAIEFAPESIGLLDKISREAEHMLHRQILPYWLSMTDPRGGWRISVDARGGIKEQAPKTLVFSARIAWTFVTAAGRYGNLAYASAAQRALQHLDLFRDDRHGGFRASIDRDGAPLSEDKHIYGQAFALYALSAAAWAGDEARKIDALKLFHLIEQRAQGGFHGLYIESFDERWNETTNDDRALGETAARHTADTHLHLIEAYIELLRATGDRVVANALFRLIDCFLETFLSSDGYCAFQKIAHDGKPASPTIWPGHDIEASWLLDDAASLIADASAVEIFRCKARKLAQGAISSGMLNSGAWRERVEADAEAPRILWWVQAEAALGLITLGLRWRDEGMVARAARTWAFIGAHFIDPATGDWRLRVLPSGAADPSAPRIVHWKDPYHQARACMEISARIAEFRRNPV